MAFISSGRPLILFDRSRAPQKPGGPPGCRRAQPGGGSSTPEEVVTIGPEDALKALGAAHHYGIGTGHPAKLNLGDCFTPIAMRYDEPILFKGDDFTHTSIGEENPLHEPTAEPIQKRVRLGCKRKRLFRAAEPASSRG